MRRFQITVHRRISDVPLSGFARFKYFLAMALGALGVAAVAAMVVIVGYLVLGVVLAMLLVAILAALGVAMVRSVWSRRGP